MSNKAISYIRYRIYDTTSNTGHTISYVQTYDIVGDIRYRMWQESRCYILFCIFCILYVLHIMHIMHVFLHTHFYMLFCKLFCILCNLHIMHIPTYFTYCFAYHFAYYFAYFAYSSFCIFCILYIYIY